jgi:hypothetical protein
MRSQRTLHPRGFFLADVITGIGILAILVVVLAAATKEYRRGTEKLADSRQAVRLAEHAMLTLQSAKELPITPEGDSIEIAPLPETRGLPQGCVWVRVTARHNGHAAELIGVVRSDAIKGARP